MAGGPDHAVSRAAKIVDAYAARTLRVGPVGAGLTLKLVNQLLVTCHVVAAAEAERLLSQLDVDSDRAAAVLTTSWGDSAMLRRMFTRRAAVELGASEATIGGLREPQQLLADLLAVHGLDLPVTASAIRLFQDACAHGRGADDLVDVLTGGDV